MPKIIDLKYKRFHRLLVIDGPELRKRSSGKTNSVYWKCKCDCGNSKWILSISLRQGVTKSCGCYNIEIRKTKPLINLMDKKFHFLTVIDGPELRKESNGFNLSYWKCKCDCGEFTWVSVSSLKSSKTKSCGCYNKQRIKETHTKHGQSKTPLYSVWLGMKRRCYKENDKKFRFYGARGIGICKEWLDDFESFYEWSKGKYKKGLQIDRKNTYGNYDPSNCRFVTSKVNNNNRRDNFLITLDGITKNSTQWEEITGISRETITSRIKRGWTEKEALTKPPRKMRKA